MENFGEEMRMKTFFVGVWLEGGEGKKIGGAQVFSPRLTKMFSLQNGEKTKWHMGLSNSLLFFFLLSSA